MMVMKMMVVMFVVGDRIRHRVDGNKKIREHKTKFE